MNEKKAPPVWVHFKLPFPYRQRLKIMRLEAGYNNIGEMIEDWIDAKANPEVATKAKELS